MKRVSNINVDQYGEKASVFSLQKGKLPPQAVDLEEVVLGAMMIDKKGVDEVIDILQPEAFYKESHKKYHHQPILNFILELFYKNLFKESLFLFQTKLLRILMMKHLMCSIYWIKLNLEFMIFPKEI